MPIITFFDQADRRLTTPSPPYSLVEWIWHSPPAWPQTREANVKS